VTVVRPAEPQDAATVATLLHDFNLEFSTPTPGVAVLAARLETLLAGRATLALLVGEPAIGLALVTLRDNVWYDGPVALVDELYVRPDARGRGTGTALMERAFNELRERGARLLEVNVDEGDTGARRFYERHGFANTPPGVDERMLYYEREL
jgi:GNAT superfamily N-acetyltransferase